MATYMDFYILGSTISARNSAERRICELQKAELRRFQNEEQGCYPSMEELKATLSLATEHVFPLNWTQSETPSIPLSESTRSETWLASMLSLASPTNYLGLTTVSESMLPTPYTEKIREAEKFRNHEKVEVQGESESSIRSIRSVRASLTRLLILLILASCATRYASQLSQELQP